MGNALCKPDPWLYYGSDDINVILREAQTGDLILFQGRGLDAKCIGLTSLSPWWSHVGVILRDPWGKLYITEEYPSIIGEEQMRTPLYHTGAQVVSLEHRLKTYPSGKLAWRRLYTTLSTHDTAQGRIIHRVRPSLSASDSMYTAFVHFFKQLQVAPAYNLDLKDFWEYGMRTDPVDDDNDGKFVCTSWAAQVLLVMGVFTSLQLQQDGTTKPTIPGNVLLSDYDGTGSLPLRAHYDYGDLEYFNGPRIPWSPERGYAVHQPSANPMLAVQA